VYEHGALDAAERVARGVGLAALFATLVVLVSGLWRGTRRLPGRESGQPPGLMRTRTFYVLASTGYFGLCYRLWRPIPIALGRPARAGAVALGSLFYFSGLALVAWGRLALGAMYNVSSSFGAQLFADHRLVTHGPFAVVRHPMYLGILLVGWGGLLLYRTWTFAFVLLHFPALLIRARREEQVLAATFGEQWADYCRRVPAWKPQF